MLHIIYKPIIICTLCSEKKQHLRFEFCHSKIFFTLK